MKIGVLLFFGTLFTFQTLAQSQPPNKQTIISASHLKSGNSQDILTSFYQIALQNLTGDKKTIQFNGSLFAIKAKTNPELWNTLNYTKNTFARNFVISANINLDTAYRLQSSTLGFRYAIINKRDKTVFNFSLDREEEWNTIVDVSLGKFLKGLNNNVNNPDFKKASDFFNDQAFGSRTTIEDLPQGFKDTLASVINTNRFFRNTSLVKFRDHLQGSFDSLSKVIENKPLLVLGGDFAGGTDGKLFTALNFSTEYMQGLLNNNSKMNLELHIKAVSSFEDNPTSFGRDLNRGVFSAFVGFNWIILKNTNRKSILELKGGMADNRILSGLYLAEKRQSFTGEGTLRFRINDNLWVPFDIKYDPAKGNVFGFLSIKSNFDWLGAARNNSN